VTIPTTQNQAHTPNTPSALGHFSQYLNQQDAPSLEEPHQITSLQKQPHIDPSLPANSRYNLFPQF
jgi:hypothetical protein